MTTPNDSTATEGCAQRTGSACYTHYAARCNPPWIAIHRETALEMLKGYDLTEDEKTNIACLMAGYCGLLEDASLIHYGQTEAEAVAKACGLVSPNDKVTQSADDNTKPKEQK